ncbi:MAG: Eukaryotic translation initiation factor 3 subunit [Actinomycetia bacterium]|nr:Eukaryotic translation initiation factor 3 subunit [Actinomycetes bacterium]
MASTRSRPRGREHARPPAGGVAAEHATKIYTVAVIGIVVIVAFLALTSIGHVIDAATQHFMLYYAGVLSLIALCASVGLGLVATDRMLLNPGHRVFIQSAHRAASFGAVAFLIIHITTEILAQRVHVLDAVIPFLSPFRTFYIGLGTIASDLILLLVITGILRGRFNASGKAWRWRAIHYTSYLSFVFGVWHGLLGGRPGKAYVDWSYGFLVAIVLLGLAVRVLSNSLKPKENLSAPPVDLAANSASAPLRAAAMLAQYGGARVGRTSILGASTGAQPVLSAPVSAQVLTALPAGGATTDQGQPYYEPGYEGPPRYLGAPRSTGTGPMPRSATGPMPRAGTGPMPRAATGPLPRATGPMPAAGTGPLPPSVSGAMPRLNTGPMPRSGTGPYPAPPPPDRPQAYTGPMPRAATGPYPAPPPPDRPQAYTGPMPRAATGPHPQPDDGWGTAPRSRPAPGPVPGGHVPRGGTGPRPRPTGPMARGSGPYQRPATGPMSQPGRPAPPPGYAEGAGGGRPDRQGWPDDRYDGNWYPEEPQWDGGFPDTDPNLRYRDPGPGMPGYRGSREHRYGGDRY